MLHRIDDRVGHITLNRPHCMNAIDLALATSLGHAIADLGHDPDVNVIVIRGAGGNFSAGGDFTEVQRLRAAGSSALTTLFAAFRAACDGIATIDVPVIVAVEGVAAAGGFELMQTADIVLVSDNARIADSHVKFGMVPGGGSTARLPRIVGRQQAMGLLLSGDEISGVDAARLGLAYRSYPQSEFDDGVMQFAQVLAARNREAVTTIKRLVNSHLDRSFSDALDVELATVVRHICATADSTVGERFKTRRREGCV
ncbi:MAG: enoyl-CoA hydratase/isomerase family protein [Mycobacterium sp.]